ATLGLYIPLPVDAALDDKRPLGVHPQHALRRDRALEGTAVNLSMRYPQGRRRWLRRRTATLAIRIVPVVLGDGERNPTIGAVERVCPLRRRRKWQSQHRRNADCLSHFAHTFHPGQRWIRSAITASGGRRAETISGLRPI